MINSTARLVLVINRGRHIKGKFQDMTLIYVAYDIICFVLEFVARICRYSLSFILHYIPRFPEKEGCYDQSCHDDMTWVTHHGIRCQDG